MGPTSSNTPRSRMLGASTLVFLALTAAAPAHAYIDPGTGSSLFYLLTAALVSGYLAVRAGYHYILERLMGGGDHLRETAMVAVHCESPSDETTLLPIIQSLARRHIEVSLFTMYARTADSVPLPSGVLHRTLSNTHKGQSRLNTLSANVLLTVTPQVDVTSFRRSRNVSHYCLALPGLSDGRFSRPFAYDYFDSVLCCGPHLAKNIRSLESRRGLPLKKLPEIGVPRFDALKSIERQAHTPVDELPRVLVAPSGVAIDVFAKCAASIASLVDARFKVIVRPPPNLKHTQCDEFQRLLRIKGVSLDPSASAEVAIERSDLVISDIFGPIYESALVFEKPVLLIEVPFSLDPFEGYLLSGNEPLLKACSELIHLLSHEQLGEIVEHIRCALARDTKALVEKLRPKVLHNFGCAADAAAEHIEAILTCL